MAMFHNIVHRLGAHAADVSSFIARVSSLLAACTVRTVPVRPPPRGRKGDSLTATATTSEERCVSQKSVLFQSLKSVF